MTERPIFKSRKVDTGIELTIALPGVPKDELNVSVEGQLLTVAGKRTTLEGFETPDHQIDEARDYELKLQLHEDLDPGVIAARYREGLLTLGLQKRKELAPRKIDILAN